MAQEATLPVALTKPVDLPPIAFGRSTGATIASAGINRCGWPAMGQSAEGISGLRDWRMIDVALGGDCGADSLFDEAGDFVDPDVSPAAQLDSIADLEFRCGFRRLVVFLLGGKTSVSKPPKGGGANGRDRCPS